MSKKSGGFSIFPGNSRFVLSGRSACRRFHLRLRGRDYVPPRFDLVSWLFLRALGLIYFAAFVSFGVQARGLIGSHGILPLAELIDMAGRHSGAERYWLMPMVFWLDASDFFIQAVCWAGAVLSLFLVANILPRVSLCLLYAFYLSLIYAGQTFMTFQWDFLLVDAGFLGLLLSIAVRPGILLLRWLTFRFMFLSGVVKIASGDPTWRDFSALSYHFQTQPLPTPPAWYAHHFPFSVLTMMTLATLFIELVLPFFIFFPWRRLRFVAGFGILLLQIVIFLTGNYNFFNLLVMALCLSLFDDAALRRALPRQIVGFVEKRRPVKVPGKGALRAVWAITLLVVYASSVQLVMFFGVQPPAPLTLLNNAIAPLRIVNTYGPFAVMTTKREEIIVEGSNDGVHWSEYAFRYKPGDVMHPVPWNIPHQPRLDWQMWFAALGPPSQSPWFSHFMQRLLENAPEVTELLENNPFPDKPPHYVRALFYDYRFSSPEEKGKTGAWWVREPEGIYFSAVTL